MPSRPPKELVSVWMPPPPYIATLIMLALIAGLWLGH